MFRKLREGLGGLVEKIVTSELKVEQLKPILQDFRINLIENDVAVSVADHICEELEKRLIGIQVKRLEDKKQIVKTSLRQVLLETMSTSEKVDLFAMVE